MWLKPDECWGKSVFSQEIMAIKTMGELWWCNLCTIIQIPQSCSVDLNALTAVNLLPLTVPASRLQVSCLHTEHQTVNEMTFIDHLSSDVWLLPACFRHRHDSGSTILPPHQVLRIAHSVVLVMSDISFSIESRHGAISQWQCFGNGRRRTNKCGWTLYRVN